MDNNKDHRHRDHTLHAIEVELNEAQERRASYSDAELLQRIYDKVNVIESRLNLHLQEEEAMLPYITQLIDILQMSKGAVMLIKIAIVIVAPLVAAIAWAKNHITL